MITVKKLVSSFYISSFFMLNNMYTGFIVKINGIQLASHEFIGGNRLTIEIKPPPQTPDTTEFDLFIGKINVFETMMQNFDPFILDPLLEAKIKYADHRGKNDSFFYEKIMIILFQVTIDITAFGIKNEKENIKNKLFV